MYQGFLGVAIAALVALSSQGAFAGQVLKLKAGNQSLASKASRALSSKDLEGHSEFVVQFNGPIAEGDKQELRKLGLDVVAYIPDDALVVIGKPESIATSQKLSSVRAVSVFQPSWKLSADFETASVFTRSKRVRTNIRFRTEGYAAKGVESLNSLGNITVRFASSKIVIADVPRNQLDQVTQVVGVEWVEPTQEIQSYHFEPGVAPVARTSRASSTGFESGTKIMGFDAAWARGFNGSGQIVGMADTGLDTGDLKTIHKDLSNTIKGVAAGWEDLGIPPELLPILGINWEDHIGHGTHVAGSVMGNGALSNGLIKGGANGAKFVAQGVAMGQGLNPMALQDPKKTAGEAYKDGARIHTNSWGADAKGAYDTLAAAYDDFMWNNPDILVVFAAGNSGLDENADGRIDEGSLGSPASAKNVMTVGASENYLLTGGIQAEANKLKKGEGAKSWPVEPLYSDKLSDNPNGMALFSSRGPAKDGRIKPDIVAPGTNIVSARSSKIDPDQEDPNRPPLWGVYDNNYLYCGGTSMATPLAAGAAVVAREYLTKQMGLSSPSAAIVKASLMHTAFDMYPGQYGTGPTQELPVPRPNVHEGYGRIDMDKLTKLGRGTLMADEVKGVGLNEEMTYTVEVPEGNLVVTMVYTDAPGAADAAKALVNDIDLIVMTPDGKTLTKNDHVNNAEMIEVKGGAAGQYTVKVKGVNVPQGKNGKQPFALIASPI